MTAAETYFSTGCGHKHGTAEAAVSCPARGWDAYARRRRPAIEVTIRPGQITRTREVPDVLAAGALAV